MKTAAVRKKISRAFTLIELMVVVAIIGLIAAMGLPSIIMALQKEGMRKAVSDVQDVCSEARAQAIRTNTKVAVVIHPQENKLEVEGASGTDASSDRVMASVLPQGISFAMVDINYQDYAESEIAKVFFFPDGTCDEATLVLQGKGEQQKIQTDFATSLTIVSGVSK